MDPTPEPLGASFRDPGGFLFRRGDLLYRQVQPAGAADYDALMESGLYEELVAAGLLVPHREVSLEHAASAGAHRVLEPEPLPFVSHPYEWCFGQLRDAALATLGIQRRALERGLMLRDASAYNVQLRAGRPIFIDTLSFGRYVEGAPWVAYRQFCQHFLAPLALMAHVDVRLGQLLRVHLDGIPLDLASRLLPRRTRLRFGLLTHLHLHARSQQRHANAGASGSPTGPRARVSRVGMIGLVESLEAAVRRLQWEPAGTEWGDYYDATNYSTSASDHKAELLRSAVDRLAPGTIWDLGANTGRYSRLASGAGRQVVSWDVDPAAVEQSYRRLREDREEGLLPLLLDLKNPSPALGWAHRERASLAGRGPVDLVLALALVHHLAIGNNLPLPRIAGFLAELGAHLLIEFAPKADSQVARMLATREDVFPDYSREGFEAAFGTRFRVLEAHALRDSERRLYLLARR